MMKKLLFLTAILVVSVGPALAENLGVSQESSKLEIRATSTLPGSHVQTRAVEPKPEHRFGVIGTIAKLPYDTVKKVGDLTIGVGKDLIKKPIEGLLKGDEKSASKEFQLSLPKDVLADRGELMDWDMVAQQAPSLTFNYSLGNELLNLERASGMMVGANLPKEEEPVKKGLGKSLLKVQFLLQDIGFSKDR